MRERMRRRAVPALRGVVWGVALALAAEEAGWGGGDDAVEIEGREAVEGSPIPGTVPPVPEDEPGLEGVAPVDPALPDYDRETGISGTLTSVGSDTLNNLMSLWAEEFRRIYPSVRIQVEGKGSSTAPPALIEGTAQLGPMSRAMKPSEIDAFEQKFGYEPTQVRVAIDALAVYVHRDNPIAQLTIPQIDAIFSKTRGCGGDQDLQTWGDLGLTGEWADKPISLYGRNAASGTYGYFKDEALCGGDFKDTVKEQPGSASVVQGVGADRYGIGYSGIGYRTSAVKPVELAARPGGPFHGTDPETVLSGEYPLSRFLYVYVNDPPNRPLSPIVREIVEFVLSEGGQRVVVKDGYLPLPAKIALEERSKIE
jgi:phosphate transport system substrate-binding protein